MKQFNTPQLLLIAGLLAFAFVGYSQTGPGGVGNSSTNGLWLKANDITVTTGSTISSWADASGNGNDAGQTTTAKQPNYFSTSSLNGMPVVRLDGTDDELTVPDANILDGTAGITFYTVLRPSNLNGSPRGILGKRVTFGTAANYAYTWFFHNSGYLNNDIVTQNNRYNTNPTAFSNATNYVLSMDYNGALPNAQRSRMFSQGVKVAQSGETSTSLINSTSNLTIGALNANYGTYLGADYAEIIQYNYSLDSAEHIIVQNYLAAKYGIALSLNDLYDEDDASNGDYDFEVAGIGRISSTILHNDAQGTGIVGMDNPTNLNDNEFMLWGHDNGVAEAIETIDVPSGVDARFDRVWRVSEVNTSGSAIDVGSVDVRWDLSAFASVTTSDLRLLIDTDNDGSFSDETPISGATSLGSSVYEFAGVSGLQNNLRFTLATVDNNQTTLPVELLGFTAKLTPEASVLVTWQTASETNNDSFTIERSANGISWNVVTVVQGAGNSDIILDYSVVDEKPLLGKSFYRLKQKDFDGTFAYSSVATIEVVVSGKINVYPNPATDVVTIEGVFNNSESIQLVSPSGKVVGSESLVMGRTPNLIQLDISSLPAGIYFVQLDRRVVKLVKQ